MADVTMKPCGDCGMPCTPAEYHPYAACLMFKACHNSATVRANLPDYEALRKRCEAVEVDAARYVWLATVPDSVCEPIQEMWRVVTGQGRSFPRKDEWDSAIDQAIAAAQEPSHG